MSASALIGQWSSTELFAALLFGICIGALVASVWWLRRLVREQSGHEAQVAQLTTASRTQLTSLEARGTEQIALLQQHIERLRSDHRAQLQRIEHRLEQQAMFDPHYWLAQAEALRAEGREAAGVAELYAGLDRTRTALGQVFAAIAVHHFVMRVGLPVVASAAHLRAAERCAQLAALLDPDDRVATQVSEDIAAAVGALRVDPQDSPSRQVELAAGDEALFLGRAAARKPLVETLIQEARAAESAGRFIVAQPLAHRALTIAVHEYGEKAEPTLRARLIYACTLIANGAYAQALVQMEAALPGCPPQYAAELHAMHMNVLARLDNWERVLSELDALLIGRERQQSGEHQDGLLLRRERAVALHALGHGEAALLEIDATLAALEHLVEPEEPAVTCAHAARAEILNGLERSAEAFAELERALPIAERIFGVEHPHALHMRWLRAVVLHDLHRYDEALDDIESLLATQTYVFGSQHPTVLQSAALRAQIMRALGREEEALLEAKRLLPLHASSFGDEHRDTVRLHGLVAQLQAA